MVILHRVIFKKKAVESLSPFQAQQKENSERFAAEFPEKVQGYVERINGALKSNKPEAIIYELLVFNAYLKSSGLSTEELNKLIAEVKSQFSSLSQKNHLAILILNSELENSSVPYAAEIRRGLEIFSSLVNKPSDKSEHEINVAAYSEALQNVESTLFRHLTSNIPVGKLLPAVTELIPNPNQRNQFKLRLYDYEMKHAKEIFNKQLELCKEDKRPGLESTATTVAKDTSEAESIVAFNFLKHIQEMILTTKWPPSTFGSQEVNDGAGNSNVVRNTMALMLKVIAKAYENNQDGKKQIWIDALECVTKIGKEAARNKPLSIFGKGKRHAAVQAFYDLFENAPTEQHYAKKK